MHGPDAIEAELERERRAFAARVDRLSERLTPEHLVAEAGGAAAEIAAKAVTGAWTHRPRRSASGATAVRCDGHRNHQQKGNLQMTHTAKTAKHVSDTASDFGDAAKASIEALRARIDDGLDGLPEAAKARVQKARAAAIDAQAEVEGRARATADAAKATARDNPLLVGALAFAAGATIAALLPRTSVENRTLGAHRDRLFDEAERIYREERERLSASASDAIEEAADDLEDRMTSRTQPIAELNDAPS